LRIINAKKDRVRLAKDQGVKDAMFAKKRGPGVLAMVKILWGYKKPRGGAGNRRRPGNNAGLCSPPDRPGW
jgi:hypothetical protein